MKLQKKPWFVCSLLLLADILLHSWLLTPLLFSALSDVLQANTVIPTLIDVAQLLLEFAFYWILFGYLSEAISHRRFGCFLLPVLWIPLRHFFELLMGYSVLGFPTWEAFLEEELAYSAGQIGLDFAMVGIAVLLILLPVKKHSFFLSLLPSAAQALSLLISAWGMGFSLSFALYLILDVVCLLVGTAVIGRFAKKGGQRDEKDLSGGTL